MPTVSEAALIHASRVFRSVYQKEASAADTHIISWQIQLFKLRIYVALCDDISLSTVTHRTFLGFFSEVG